MKHIPSYTEFINESADNVFVKQDGIRHAREIVTGLKAGDYELTQDVVAWVLDMQDKEESTTWIGKANVPNVKLNKKILKKGTRLSVSPFGQEVYLNGNKDNPIWLVNPILFSKNVIKDSFYDDLRKIVDVVKKK